MPDLFWQNGPDVELAVIDLIKETSFGWLSFVSTGISIIIALYILAFHLKPTWAKIKFDYHFQLRFVLGILLLFNRIIHLVYLILFYRKDAVWYIVGIGTGMNDARLEPVLKQLFKQGQVLEMQYNFVVSVFFCSLQVIPTLILLLTIDRYKRVAMTVPKSRLDSIFRVIQFIVIAFTIYDVLSFFLHYSGKYVGIQVPEAYGFLLDDSLMFKAVSFVFIYILYYAFTVQLIIISVRSGKIAARGFLKQVMVKMFKSTSRHPVEKSTDEDSHQASRLKRLHAGMKMLIIFMVLSVMDAFIVIMIVVLYLIKFDSRQLVNMIAFAASWIVVHVWCVFKLLDMFVKDLIKANRGENVLPFSFWRRIWRNFWLDKSSHDQSQEQSQVTDIVDLSLLSEYKTSAISKTTQSTLETYSHISQLHPQLVVRCNKD